MKKIFSFFVAKGLNTTPTNRLLCKVAIFVLVALFALPVMAGTIDVLDDSWIVGRHDGWGSSYNSETKTITFEGAWPAYGWNLESLNIPTSEWLSITVAFTSPAPGGVLKCEYTDGGDKQEGFDGLTSQTLTFDSGKTLKKIYLSLVSSGTLTLTSAVVTTSTTTYTVTVNNDGNGTASADKANYEAGETVTLTAEPNANYLFDGWTTSDVDLSGHENDNPLTFTMPSSPVTVQASFKTDTRCDYSQTIQCEIYRNQSGYADLFTSDLKPSSTDGWPADNADGEIIVVGGGKEIFFYVTLPKNAVYTFSPYVFDVASNDRLIYFNIYSSDEAESSSVQYGGNTYYKKFEGQNVSAPLGHNGWDNYGCYQTSVHELNAGTYILGLYGTNEVRYDKIVISAKDDAFCPNTITMAKSGDDGAAAPTATVEEVSVTTAFEGTVVTVTAAAASAGYNFSGWTASPEVTFADASETSTTFTMPSSDVTITANYTECTKHTVTLTAGANGSVSGGGLQCDGSVTVTATPDDGYRFVNWTQGGSPVSTNAEYTFTLSTDISLTANFEVDPCLASLTVQVEDAYLPNGAVTASKGYPTTMIFKEKKAEGNYETSCNGRGFMLVPNEGDKELFIPVNITTAGNYKVKAHSGEDKVTYINIYAITGDGETITYNSTTYYKKTYKRINEDQGASFAYSDYTDVVSLPIGVCLIGLYSEYSYAAYDEIIITCTDGKAFCPNTITMAKSGDDGADAPTAQVNSSNVTTAFEGTVVTVTADDPSANHYFTGWTVSPENAVTFADASSLSTTFTMPDEDVTLTANYAFTISSLPWTGSQDLADGIIVTATPLTSALSHVVFTYTGSGTVKYYDNTDRSTILGSVTSGDSIALTSALRSNGIYLHCTSGSATLTKAEEVITVTGSTELSSTTVSHLIIHQGGQVTNSSDITITGSITYHRPATTLDRWFTFAVPFTLSVIEVYDETDKAWFDVNAVYYTTNNADQSDNNPTGRGHFYLKYLKNDGVNQMTNDRWMYIDPGHSEQLYAADWSEDRYGYPKKDSAYIILFDSKKPVSMAGYWAANPNVRFVGIGSQTIDGTLDEPTVYDGDDKGYGLYANNTLHSVTLKNDAYVLSEDGTRFDLEKTPTIKPFECYIQATEAFKKVVASIPMRRQGGDTPTAIEDIELNDTSRTIKVLRQGHLIIIRNGHSYDIMGARVR